MRGHTALTPETPPENAALFPAVSCAVSVLSSLARADLQGGTFLLIVERVQLRAGTFPIAAAFNSVSRLVPSASLWGAVQLGQITSKFPSI